MRVLLKKGMQRKLLEEYNKASFNSWNDFSKILRIDPFTLLGWQNETSLIPYNIFLNLDSIGKYSDQIIELKDENWYRVSKPKNRVKNNSLVLPKKSEKLAEFIGIILGDGNLSEYDAIRIAGDSRKDRDYLEKYIVKLIRELFNCEPSLYFSKRSNCLYVYFGSKIVSNYLVKCGLKKGNKIKNNLTIPSWIMKNPSYLKACLRGLIDTDGSVYELLPKWPGLYQIYFGNRNLILLEDTHKGFSQLGFVVSKLCNFNNKLPCFYITRKSEIQKYITEIGFSNIKHKEKLVNFQPPN